MGYSVFPAPASGPTLAEITTAIQNNATPYNGTWTDIAYQSGNGLTAVTFSSISGYKTLRLASIGLPAGGGNINVTFNGDTGGNYSTFTLRSRDTTNTFTNVRTPQGTSIVLGLSDSGSIEAHLTIQNASSSTASKQLSLVNAAWPGATGGDYLFGIYRSTSPITSITITRGGGGTWATSSPIGFYLYGAN